jgi:hypothetical protein
VPVSSCNILVVANRTVGSAGLAAALRARAEHSPTQYTLVVPLGRIPDARRIADDLAAELRAAGLDVTGHAGDADPLVAVLELWNPAHYDEIIVSTLPSSNSRWMRSGLPQRIERQTGALVRHIEARDPAETRSSPAIA